MSRLAGLWPALALALAAVAGLSMAAGGARVLFASGAEVRQAAIQQASTVSGTTMQASCMATCMQRVFTEPYSRVGQLPPTMLCRDPYEQHCASRCAGQ